MAYVLTDSGRLGPMPLVLAEQLAEQLHGRLEIVTCAGCGQ